MVMASRVSSREALQAVWDEIPQGFRNGAGFGAGRNHAKSPDQSGNFWNIYCSEHLSYSIEFHPHPRTTEKWGLRKPFFGSLTANDEEFSYLWTRPAPVVIGGLPTPAFVLPIKRDELPQLAKQVWMRIDMLAASHRLR